MNLIELLKKFHAKAVVNKYPPSVRVCYGTIVLDMNAKYWPEHCIYSERGLSDLTCLPKATVHKALSYLAERGLINVRKTKQGTLIRLVDATDNASNHAVTTEEPPSNHKVTTSAVCNTRPRIDLDADTDFISIDSSRARTDCVNVDSGLIELWIANKGASVTAELLSYLSALVNRHGEDWVANAIRTAASEYGGSFYMSLKYFRERIVPRLEGGITRGKVVPISRQVATGFNKPDTRFDKELGI